MQISVYWKRDPLVTGEDKQEAIQISGPQRPCPDKKHREADWLSQYSTCSFKWFFVCLNVYATHLSIFPFFRSPSSFTAYSLVVSLVLESTSCQRKMIYLSLRIVGDAVCMYCDFGSLSRCQTRSPPNIFVHICNTHLTKMKQLKRPSGDEWGST